MPAAAVIPAPIAYINVVAVKKLVVEMCELSIIYFHYNFVMLILYEFTIIK